MRKGSEKVLETLFEAGAIAEKRDTFPGDTPFAVAAKYRQFKAMKRLLELKQASDEVVTFVLENACMDGKEKVVDFILLEVKPPIAMRLFRLCAVRSNAPVLLKTLVKHGANVREQHEENGNRSDEDND